MGEPFKNLFNKDITEIFCDKILENFKEFDKKKFIFEVFNESFENLELKERMDYITKSLYRFLPKNYEETIGILKKASLGQSGFFYMILPHYVELYGLDNFEVSVNALEEFTKLCSSEFAVRPFLIKYEELMIKTMENWSKSENTDVRRLASEGSRPILPWAIDIPFLRKNPENLKNILENLVDDESEYVRKSVANNLNAISKDNPQFVITFAKKWFGTNKNIDKLIKHGLRTLLKAGNKEALNIIGYDDKKYTIENFELNNHVIIGENLNFTFSIKNEDSLGKLRIEYFIHLLRQKDKYSKKIFKLSEFVSDETTKTINKNHSFKRVTTRNYYEGRHFLTLVINGVEYETKEFYLKEQE